MFIFPKEKKNLYEYEQKIVGKKSFQLPCFITIILREKKRHDDIHQTNNNTKKDSYDIRKKA